MPAAAESPFVPSGAVVSYGKYETPHADIFSYSCDTVPLDELYMNRDYGVWDAEAGLVVGDGIGREEGADMASQSVVNSIIMRASSVRLSEMASASEAVEAVREVVLPFADKMLQRDKLRHNLPEAKTLASGVLYAKNHAIVHWSGDVRVYEYLPGSEGFQQLTYDQFVIDEETEGPLVSNYFQGTGRNPTGYPEYDDQVIARPLVPRARYLAVTDGFYGNLVHQTIPSDKLDSCALSSNDPEEIVRRLSALPLELVQKNTVIEVERGNIYYRPRHDDMTIGVTIVQ